MASAISTADEFLKVAKRNDVKLTPLQLMKLVYMAHGLSLAIRNVGLFQDRIEAWKFGPVIPNLYHATKSFGRNQIPYNKIDEASSGLDDDEIDFVNKVFDKYGHLSGYALSSLTHESGTPWDNVYEDGVFHKEISDELIKNHYTDMLNG